MEGNESYSVIAVKVAATLSPVASANVPGTTLINNYFYLVKIDFYYKSFGSTIVD